MSIVALPVQVDNFSLSGAGSSIGDTVLNLKSFKDINGTNLTMADFGSIGYGTIEPGNGTQEEQISFSGVTQNSDGTAQLTGVKHVLFKTPFTETSGMTVTHPGSVSFVISNTSGFENAIYTYINNAVASGGVPATASQQGITKLSVDPASLGTPIAVGDNDPRVPTSTERSYLSSIVNTGIPYAVATGTASSFTATLASSISSLASGTFLNILVPTTNATGLTLNVNSLGAKPVYKNYNVTPASGDLVAGQVASLVYNGTSFQLQTPVPQTPVYSGSGQTTANIASATTTVIAHGLAAVPKMVNIYAVVSAAGPSSFTNISAGSYNGTTQTCVDFTGRGTTQTASSSSSAVLFFATGSGGDNASAAASVDATNITLTWSRTGSPTGTATITWSAIA